LTGRQQRFAEFVTAGTWCVDHNKLLPNWPREDTSTEILDIATGGGGSACNFAIDLKQLDGALKVATIGRLGNDENGRFLKQMAEERHINTDGLKLMEGETTSVTDAYTNRGNGHRTHMFHVGSNANMVPEDFDFDGKGGCFLHLGLAGAHAALDRPHGANATGWVTVLEKARRAGMTINIELMSIAPDRLARLNRPSLPYLDMLMVNDWEIGALSGEVTVNDHGTSMDACKRAARKVLEAGAMEFVVVHAPKHAFCLTRDQVLHEKAAIKVPAEAIAGANGAGDAFAAGFVCGLARDAALDTCLAFGHATAAASLRHTTTTGAVAGIEDCLALAEQWGWS